MLPKPGAPFESWPIQCADPRFGYAWYLGGGLIVSHVTVTHGDGTAAGAYHDFEASVLSGHADEIARARGIFVIHDWRAMLSYETSGRKVWLERMQQRAKGYLRGSVVCIVRPVPLLRMAVQAANLVASVTHGAKVDLTTDLQSALRRHGADEAIRARARPC